jgi:hypothetical protein
MQIISLARIALYVLYAIVLAYLCVYFASLNRPPAPPTATQDLRANHQIVRGDLQTEATAALVGSYLAQKVEAGKPVTAAIVRDRPIEPMPPNAIAAVVNIPARVFRQRGISQGKSVQIISSGLPLGDPVPVLRTDCDEQICTILVGLKKVPAFDQVALTNADIVLASPPVLSAPAP